MKERTYICCDLKSFYASVECIERGLNPLDTNLVVADLSRTEKTICLAVTPSLKSYGISGRARLFEVIQRVKEVNAQRQRNTPGRQFTSASSHDPEVRRNPSLALDYIVAPPRMAHYIDWSTRVYSVYLKHVAPEDIYPYSIDEVFIDATSYLQTYHLSAREFARKIILDILQTTGITAAAGIGTNLYLAKVAMDIGAKHVPADEYGVRIAELDEMGYVVTVGRAGEKEIDFVCEKRGEKLYVQVTYLLASEDTVKREFGAYDGIQDNFPKYVVSLDEFDMSRNGIKHRNIRDFLLAEEWN